jgi:hypothetical protein
MVDIPAERERCRIMIEEVLPGLVNWSAFHEGIKSTVYSSFVLRSGTLIDPMVPEEGLDAIGALAIPQRVVLTNRHHYRHSAQFAKRFGCPVLCHEKGLHVFGGDRPVQGFSFGEAIADDIQALKLASICPEETTLCLDLQRKALSFADGLTRGQDGRLAFMPDKLLGEHPQKVREGLSHNLRAMLEEDFDAMLFAHAEPLSRGGHEQLESFLDV